MGAVLTVMYGIVTYAFFLATLQSFDWVRGGTSPPAIGPKGQVYAIASNILFVFPPPLQIADRPTRGTIGKTR
ncbi:MAG: hypothetical protein ABI981_00010 [Betaproteobacteria bacterium]